MLLNQQELCERLNVTRHALYGWRKEGMPCYKGSRKGRVLYKEDEVLAWMREQAERFRDQ